jgi:hypothetical protein
LSSSALAEPLTKATKTERRRIENTESFMFEVALAGK